MNDDFDPIVIKVNSKLPFDVPPLQSLQSVPIINQDCLTLVVGLDEFASLDLKMCIEGRVNACYKDHDGLGYLVIKFEYEGVQDNSVALECPLYIGGDSDNCEYFQTYLEEDICKHHSILNIVCIDGKTSIVKGMRTITLPPAINSGMVKTFARQANDPLTDIELASGLEVLFRKSYQEHIKGISWHECGK
jgi:hypothetical protein